MDKMTKTCPYCEKKFRLGYNGVIFPKLGCDKCLGIQRDSEGRAWWPEERVKTLAPVNWTPGKSKKRRLTRAEAFGKKK